MLVRLSEASSSSSLFNDKQVIVRIEYSSIRCVKIIHSNKSGNFLNFHITDSNISTDF